MTVIPGKTEPSDVTAVSEAQDDILAYRAEGEFVIGERDSEDAWISCPYTVPLTEAR